MEIKKVRLVMKTDFSTKFHMFGFWLLVIFILGILLGNWYSTYIIEKRLSQAATCMAIKIDEREYDLKERP